MLFLTALHSCFGNLAMAENLLVVREGKIMQKVVYKLWLNFELVLLLVGLTHFPILVISQSQQKLWTQQHPLTSSPILSPISGLLVLCLLVQPLLIENVKAPIRWFLTPTSIS